MSLSALFGLSTSAPAADPLLKVTALKQKGSYHFGRREWAYAVDQYDQAIGLCPDSPQLHANRSHVLKQLRRFDDAIKDADECIRIDWSVRLASLAWAPLPGVLLYTPRHYAQLCPPALNPCIEQF